MRHEKEKKMKRSSKILAVALALALLFGAVMAIVASAATTLVQNPTPNGAVSGGFLDFDTDTDTKKYDSYTYTWNSNMPGSKARMYVGANWTSVHTNLLKTQTVDGRTNKYLDVTRDEFGTTYSSTAFFGTSPNTLAYPNADKLQNDFYIFDIDLMASYYQYNDYESVIDSNTGVETVTATGELKTATTLDGLLPEERATAKLSYPEGMYISLDVTTYNVASDGTLSDAGTSNPKAYIISKTVTQNGEQRKVWYLRMTQTENANYGEMQLSDTPGEWNHITMVYKFLNAPTSTKLAYYAYLDGKYVGANETTYTGYTRQQVYAEETRLIISAATISNDKYSFGIDNFFCNAYSDYVPSDDVKTSLVDITNYKQDYAFFNCDDVIYNKNYISPNGNKFALDWVDANGDVIVSEKIDIATAPNADKTELELGSYPGIKGDFKNIAAWEWNVSEDPTVFTPVSTLAFDMIRTVRDRGDSKITLRPAVVDVNYVDALGSLLASDKYFAGSAAESFETASNGWYSTVYPVLANVTEGEASDSFTVVRDKANVFTADVSNAVPTASVKGIKFNMSLLTNYYMNIYVPQDASEGITPLGYFAEEDLINKYTQSVRKVSIGGDVYEEHSFVIRNSDIDLEAPRYYGFEVKIGENTYRLAYKISVDLITYAKGVLEAYSCGSEEAALAVNLLNYANEAYKIANGEAHSATVNLIAKHKTCGCLTEYDAASDYKGNVSTLSEYVYGAAYDVTSAEPAFVLYVRSSKIDDVSMIKITHDGVMGEVEAYMTALDAMMIDGVSVIPYTYRGVSASDVKEVMEISIYDANESLAAGGSYGLSNYVFNSDAPVAKALYAFSSAAAEYKISVVGSTESPIIISGIEAKKTSSLRPSSTVSLGDEIRYTITITNNNSEALDIPVSDMIPANTAYVSGGAAVDGFKLSWTVNVGAGETKEINYVVKYDKNTKLLDKGIIFTAPEASVGGNPIVCNEENYVARTINAVDAFYMKAGIEAMSYSDETVRIVLGSTAAQEAAKESPLAVIKFIYSVAFSKTFTINTDGTVADVINALFEKTATDVGLGYRQNVAPTLWGGSSVTSVCDGFKGESSDFERADLVIGDILFVKDANGARVYVYDGDDLISFTNGYEKADTTSAINAANVANYYAVMRPTMTMTSLTLSDPDAPALDLTPQQKALVETAYQYVLRGTRLQYDDGNLGTSSEYRWQIGSYQPEDVTEQNWKYINCAGFTYDIYRMALGYDLEGLYTTASLMRHFTNGNAESDMYPFYFQWDANIHSDKTRQAEIEKRFLETLEVGDLVVITRGTTTGGYGHVMMYVGNGMLAHSTGSTRSGDTEIYEPTIRYMNVWSYLFNPTASNYLFIETPSSSTVYQTCIVRPLSKCGNIDIPENTENRLNNLLGIISEKLSSHPEGLTVNKDEEITYTYKIKNTNKTARTLEITDVVPANSTLVAAPDAALDGDKLSWTVTVGAGETVTVSFTVKATGEYGSYIYGAEGKVGGVRHTCPGTYIENTLTAEQQAAILEAIEYYRANNTEGLTNFALVNAIYERAGLPAPFADGVTSTTLKADLFKASTTNSSLYEFNKNSEYYEMVAPTFYGGGKFYTRNYYSSTNKTSSDRSRLPRTQGLVFGDIIVAEFSSSSGLYMYTGEGSLVSIGATLGYDTRTTHNRLQRMLSAGKYYTILRPSMSESFVADMEDVTVNFNSDVGNVVAHVRVKNGGVISAPTDPVRANHVFLGWFLNGEEYDFATPVTENITLVAGWQSILDDSEIYDGMQTVLLLGQSNMMGQGDVNIVDPITDDRIFMMRDDRWVKMQEPLHTNSHQAGIGLGASFAKAFVETFDTNLGLIAAAKGATTLEDWAVGGALYNEAVRRAKIALETSEICAILWHQGEGDQYNTEYSEQLSVILNSMISELDLDPDKIVIITGELYGSKGDSVHTPELIDLGKNYKNYGIVQSDGLTLMSDKIHFDSPSLRVFGYRYFDMFYNKVAGRSYNFIDDPVHYYSEQTPIDEHTWFPFDELVTGSAPAGAVGSGNMGLYLQNGSANILEETETDKYLSVSNGLKTDGSGYTTTFVNSYEFAAGGSVIVTEGQFRLGEGSNCDAYLLMVVTEEGTNNGVYKSVVIGANGTLYTISATGARTAVGTVGTETWVHVKVVLDLGKNLKSVYIGGVAVMENATISNTVDTSAYAVESVSLMQFSVNVGNTIGTVHVDDYRFYPYE